MTRDSAADVRLVNDEALRQWPLPMPGAQGDKEDRGRALVIAGSPEMPGAAVLAATAAIRAGAGQLVIGTTASTAHLVALAVPEARVISLAERRDGVALSAIEPLTDVAADIDAAVIGPGMQGERPLLEFVHAILPAFAKAKLVLDAKAMDVVKQDNFRFSQSVCLTPHAGEMAHLIGISKAAVEDEPSVVALSAARRWNAVVALKGATTFIAVPDGTVWKHEGGNIGLGVSGSGDTLAGIIAGLAARGASVEQACVWGVALHGRAGDILARRLGELGYLAREIPGELPALMQGLRPCDDAR